MNIFEIEMNIFEIEMKSLETGIGKQLQNQLENHFKGTKPLR